MPSYNNTHLNEDILTKLLGYSREEVAKLKEEGII